MTIADNNFFFWDELGRQEIRRVITRLQGTGNTELSNLSPLLVTSAVEGEGKSLLASSFALMAAREFELRTLIVDLNWGAASQHHLFGVEQDFTAAQLLSNGPENWVRKLGDGAPDVLPAPKAVKDTPKGSSTGWTAVRDFSEAGEGAPADKKSRLALLGDIVAFSEKYQFVIFDGPAMYSSTPGPLDALQIAAHAKSTVVVVKMRSTAREPIKRTINALTDAQAKPAGLVLNNVDNPLY